MKNKEVKRFLAKALIMTVIASNIGLTTITPAFAAESKPAVEAAAEENETEQNTEGSEDENTQDQDTQTEVTASKVVIRSENVNTDVKVFVDDQEITGTENEDGTVSYEVENGKTLKMQVNAENGSAIQVTKTNNETGEEEVLTPDENGFYLLEVNQDESLTFTPVDETEENMCLSGHITATVAKSDSEGFQWETVNAEEELMNKSEEEIEEYTEEVIEEQNVAASVPVDSVESANETISTRDCFEGLTEALFSSLGSGDPGALAGWGGKTIFQLIFGTDDDQADQVSEMLDTINGKSDQILNQLNQMEYRLEEIQKGVTDIKEEQKIQNIRNDLRNVVDYRVKVETLLKTMKSLDKNHTGSDREVGFYQDALRRLDTETLNDLMHYGNALITKGAATGKSAFYVVSELISLSDIGWESEMQEPQFYQNAQLITPYLEAASYVTVLKEYELSQLKEGSAEYIATKSDIQLIKEQVNEIKEEMDKNKIENNRPAGTIAFYLKSGHVVLLSDKVRFQTDESNRMNYISVARKEAINNWETMKNKGHYFTDYLLGREETVFSTKSLEAANSSIQAAIGNSLAVMDHENGHLGARILADLGFDIKYNTDTLTVLTSDCVEVKTDGKQKSFGVHTITLDSNNNVSKGMTYFQYTDKNGNFLEQMVCDKKGFVTFMLKDAGTDDAAANVYNRYNTLHNFY